MGSGGMWDFNVKMWKVNFCFIIEYLKGIVEVYFWGYKGIL